MTLDLAKIKSDAEKVAANSDLLLMPLPVKDVLGMLAEIEITETRLHDVAMLCATVEQERDQLKAENEALKNHRADWQAKCLKRGFQYVRESDDHYVLADLPEMAELLGELLGVEVRTKDGDSYGEALSVVQEQLDAANNAFLQAYEAEKECEKFRKDAERYRSIRDNELEIGIARFHSNAEDLFLNGTEADECVDAAIAKERP